jgi:hypothetical protein
MLDAPAGSKENKDLAVAVIQESQYLIETPESVKARQRFEMEGKAAHLFRNLLAEERKRRDLPPIFWCVNKPKDRMSQEEWDEWLKQFKPFELDYEQVPRWASLQS